jgi:DNA-binding transcriptional LysR family regulator
MQTHTLSEARMTTFQIQCFLQVAQCLNFTEAANHLFIAQSSLSRNISNLENELNMKLFIRTRKYVRLTPGGAVLYREFSRLMKEIDQAVDQARNVEIGQSGLLRIGVIETQRSDNFLPEVLKTLRKKHPLINVDIQSGNFKDLRENVLNGQVDIALTMAFDLTDFPQDKIVSQNFRCSTGVCAMPKSHPLAGKSGVNINQMAEDTLIAISPDVSHGAYNSLIDLCAANGFTPRKIITARSIQDMLLNIESGLGYTVQDSNSISLLNRAVANVPLEGTTDPLFLTAVWCRSNLNPIIPIFMEILMDKACNLAPEESC